MNFNLCPNCFNRVASVNYEKHCVACGWVGTYWHLVSEPVFAVAPRPPYVSIDLETTGLNPVNCQILEFGAVYDDWVHPTCQLPCFKRYIHHAHLTGEPFALQMNAKIIKAIADNAKPICPLNYLEREFCEWLSTLPGRPRKVTVAGKNFASFDLPFLRVAGFENCFHRRVLDPSIYFWREGDEALPNSQLCMERAEMEGMVAHNTVDDAMMVVQLLRRAVAWYQLKPNPFGFNQL